MKKLTAPCILYVASFPPRQCGIATFTQDLTNAMDKEFNPGVKSRILAINDNGTSIYNYPKKVFMQINEGDMESYLSHAKAINALPQIKLVNIQHEYGLFGGDWGNYLLPFMEIIDKPIVTTLHTVLPRPDEELKRITRLVAQKSNGLIVMTESSARLLEEVYEINRAKVQVIPHGVHHVAFPSKSKAKKKLNLSGKFVLSTFGMLNRDKGLEYAIEALPRLVEKHPDVIYLILGATHPLVRQHEGEVYRNKLKKLIAGLNLEDHVKFYDKYLCLEELIDFLKATDIYVSPTLNPLQAVSGTVSYALSCACPIISTATQYSRDVVSPERGVLVRFKKSQDIEKAMFDLLEDKRMRKEMKKNAYFYSRHMTWQNVALAYFKTLNDFAKIVPQEKGKLPVIDLDHFKNLTDKFGMVQFARHTKPDYASGYCLDDNTRAMLACLMMYKKKSFNPKSILNLIQIYLRFIKHMQKPDGGFYNFVNRRQDIIDKSESEDSFGRTIWALGYMMSLNNPKSELTEQARRIFKKANSHILHLKSLRAMAFSIIGLSYILKNLEAKKLTDREAQKEYLEHQKQVKKMADNLINKYRLETASPESKKKKWYWFENNLTYSNYKIPESLLRAYQVTGNKDYLTVAEESLKFLATISFEHNYFSPIGQNGWYYRDGKRAYFDQQPEDTSSAVESLSTAYKTTGKKQYADQAMLAFNWFLGKNHLNQMVYDEATGGCYDGLGKESLNFNQGAESTISYLLARLAVESI